MYLLLGPCSLFRKREAVALILDMGKVGGALHHHITHLQGAHHHQPSSGRVTARQRNHVEGQEKRHDKAPGHLPYHPQDDVTKGKEYDLSHLAK